MKKHLVILTGAGVSAESGFATFRDTGGLWEQYNVNDVASIEGWYRNRKLVLEFYNQRRAQLKDAKPNAAHVAMAELEKDFRVDVITQNVDNLHERAGSTRVLHLHGELTKVRPENGIYDRTESEAEVIDVGYRPVILGDLAPNGSQLRPHIVFFGEAVPNIGKAIDLVEQADILLIVGSSLQVYPAAGLYRYARNDCPIYVIDPKPVPISDPRVTFIQDVATKGMARFVELVEVND
jgi:NAD-dependent deacetylase